jgi:hypothetical protein
LVPTNEGTPVFALCWVLETLCWTCQRPLYPVLLWFVWAVALRGVPEEVRFPRSGEGRFLTSDEVRFPTSDEVRLPTSTERRLPTSGEVRVPTSEEERCPRSEEVRLRDPKKGGFRGPWECGFREAASDFRHPASHASPCWSRTSPGVRNRLSPGAGIPGRSTFPRGLSAQAVALRSPERA